MNFKQAFTRVYDEKIWGDGSGGGSIWLDEYRSVIREFIRKHKITSVTDFGCGYFFDDYGIDYTGVDCVGSVVNYNKQFETKSRRFICADTVDTGELLLVKDVFQHWRDKDIKDFLKRVRFKYVITTNSIDQHHVTDKDIFTRPISPEIFGNYEILGILDFNKNDIKQILLL